MKTKTNTVEKKYGARYGAPFKKKHAQVIGEFLDNIPEEIRDPPNILKEIKKHKEHVIHDYIEWDDKKASVEYRLQQIRNIVNHVTYKIKEVGSPDVPIRAFYSVHKEDNGAPVYVHVHMTFTNEYYRLQVIQRAYTELCHWCERFKQYEELKDVIAAISPFVDKV